MVDVVKEARKFCDTEIQVHLVDELAKACVAEQVGPLVEALMKINSGFCQGNEDMHGDCEDFMHTIAVDALSAHRKTTGDGGKNV